MSETPVPDGIDLAQWAGSRILGILFNLALFGVLSMQVYLYYLAFPKDPLRNKLFVYTTFIIELAQTLVVIRSAFIVFGSGYGNWAIYDNVELTWFSIPLVSGVVAFLAEGFYAYRISVLAQSYRWASIIVLLASLQLGGSIATSVVVIQSKVLSGLFHRSFFVSEGIWNGGSAVCDVIIAGCMIYYLQKRGSGSHAATKVLIQKVVTLVIETGTVTAALALLNVIIVSIPGHPPYFATPAIVLAKVYSNSMMVVLNSRIKVSSVEGSSGADGSHRSRSDGGQHGGSQAYSMQPRGVMINREQLVSKDDRSDVMFQGTSAKVDIFPDV